MRGTFLTGSYFLRGGGETFKCASLRRKRLDKSAPFTKFCSFTPTSTLYLLKFFYTLFFLFTYTYFTNFLSHNFARTDSAPLFFRPIDNFICVYSKQNFCPQAPVNESLTACFAGRVLFFLRARPRTGRPERSPPGPRGGRCCQSSGRGEVLELTEAHGRPRTH